MRFEVQNMLSVVRCVLTPHSKQQGTSSPPQQQGTRCSPLLFCLVHVRSHAFSERCGSL